MLRWTASDVAVRQDLAGNIKPDKERSRERIDDMSAIVNAVGRPLLRDNSRFICGDGRRMLLLEYGVPMLRRYFPRLLLSLASRKVMCFSAQFIIASIVVVAAFILVTTTVPARCQSAACLCRFCIGSVSRWRDMKHPGAQKNLARKATFLMSANATQSKFPASKPGAEPTANDDLKSLPMAEGKRNWDRLRTALVKPRPGNG